VQALGGSFELCVVITRNIISFFLCASFNAIQFLLFNSYAARLDAKMSNEINTAVEIVELQKQSSAAKDLTTGSNSRRQTVPKFEKS
jgi:hypothetical protein